MRVPERDSNPMEGGQLPLAVKTTFELDERTAYEIA